MASSIISSVVTAGSNSHATVSEEANAYATDFVSQGVWNPITNTNGSSPATGSFAVNQDSSPDMGLTITSGVAYVTVTPASQDSQVLRARMSANYTSYTINANSSGSTVYDWIYLQGSATNAATPSVAADNVITLFTSRSTANTSDTGSPPTYGILLAVVTVVNGASSITNSNIADKRTQATLSTSATSVGAGWVNLGYPLTYSANNGNKEFAVTSANNLTGILSPGMKLQVTRATTPPTQCMAFVAASSEYATKASPSGITFTGVFTCEAWVYVQSYTGQAQTIINRLDAAATSGGWEFQISSTGQPVITYGTTTTFTQLASYQSVPLNTWVHVAGVVTSVSSKTGQIYINATAVPTNTTLSNSTTLTQASVDLRIGANSATPTNTYFNGYISEVRVWSAAQSAANIQANMTKSLVGNESNLVALYQGNGNFNDATSNANNLTATNSPIATQASNPYNAIEYANIRAISYSNPTTTITLYTGDSGTIPNMTLNTPQYSISREPFGLPEVLNSKILGQIIWGANVTSTATATGTQLNGATLTMTIPANGKKVVIKALSSALYSGAGVAFLSAYNGSTQVAQIQGTSDFGWLQSLPFYAPAGSQTFSLDMWESSAGTSTWQSSTAYPSWFTVEEA